MPISLINVSNRLPVTITPDGIVPSSGGLVTALEGLPKDEYQLTWLGWPGGNVADDQHGAIEQQLREQLGYSPVFIPTDLADAHYEGFSNSSIWPLLHYLPSYLRYKTEWWDAYQKVNQLFAERVLSVAKDEQIVWVHDYQLMLLPKLLREGNPTLKIGFFLHTPFPSSEVFRCHPNREALLEGMLGADLCGFHTFGYLRQFRSSAAHILGANSEITAIQHSGRQTQLGVFPIGIPAQKFDAEMLSPAMFETLSRLSAEHAGRKIVLSVERLDYTKGILPRLDAIELVLSRMSPEQRDAIKFMFISIPTRQGVDAYAKLRDDVQQRVGAINGKYATLHNSPVHFIHGSVKFNELCALYAMADVALVTPLRDGLNLVAKEYVACQRDISAGGTAARDVPGAPEMVNVRATPGVLILSEFTGAAEELLGAIHVNPNDAESVAHAIFEALAMPPQERRRRMLSMRYRVMNYDAAAWAEDFVGELTRQRKTDTATLALSAPDVLAGAQKAIKDSIEAGGRVAMFLDYDGTLREIVKDPFTARPTSDVAKLLDRLASLDNITTTIISGRTQTDLELFLGSYGNFNLIAEHGGAIRRARTGQWERLDTNLTYEWKARVLKLLRHFERSTPGSEVEDKITGLVWHYRRADHEFSEYKALQLVQNLTTLTADDSLEIRRGRRIVEITSTLVSKAAGVMRVLQGQKFDRILIAGDDATDESMFRIELPEKATTTIRVGPGETRAKLRVARPRQLREFVWGALP